MKRCFSPATPLALTCLCSCCWALSQALSQRARALAALAQCRADGGGGGSAACDALYAEQIEQLRRVQRLLGEWGGSGRVCSDM